MVVETFHVQFTDGVIQVVDAMTGVTVGRVSNLSVDGMLLLTNGPMRENARDLYAWLEEGAEVFICGDKGKMAADVQKELVRIIETEGGRTPEQAAEYMSALKKGHRLKLDVY